MTDQTPAGPAGPAETPAGTPAGARGPATSENYHFLEKTHHFDRERAPERVVHARGATAFGHFEAYGTFGDQPISDRKSVV